MKPTAPNAAQIRTTTTQDTAILFSPYRLVLQSHAPKRREDAFALPKLREMEADFISFCTKRFKSAERPRTVFTHLDGHPDLLFAEPITETAHGFNRVAGFTEFFAQAPYVCVHGAGVDHAFVAPHVV